LSDKEVSMDDQERQGFAARYGVAAWALAQAETPDDPTERRKKLAASIAQRYGVRLQDVDPDGAAIRQLAELMRRIPHERKH
jgi:hypothetical protein